MHYIPLQQEGLQDLFQEDAGKDEHLVVLNNGQHLFFGKKIVEGFRTHTE